MRRSFLNLSTLIVIFALAIDVVAVTWYHGRPGEVAGIVTARDDVQTVTTHSGGPLGVRGDNLMGDPTIDQHPGRTGLLWDERMWLVAFAGIALMISLIVCGGTCQTLRRDEPAAGNTTK